MSDAVEHDFPLFPLGMVALPHEAVPLHIFEPRYRTMMAVCLEQEREFGLVLSDGDGSREIGCAMRVEQVLERFDDGRLNVLTRGTRVLRLHERHDDLPYPAGTVSFVDDDLEELDPVAAQTAQGAYRDLVEEATDKLLDPADLAGMGAFAMAATVDFGPEAKQGLLELRSENARLRLVTRLFRAAAKRLDFVERGQVRARSNGKVRFG